jgi:hypothetical protein
MLEYLYVYVEENGSGLLQNAATFLVDYTALDPRHHNCWRIDISLARHFANYNVFNKNTGIILGTRGSAVG